MRGAFDIPFDGEEDDDDVIGACTCVVLATDACTAYEEGWCLLPSAGLLVRTPGRMGGPTT